MIWFDRVSYTYPSGHTALKEVDLKLEAGSFTFLTGHTGAGKTTLMRLLMAMMRPTKGRIRVGDQLINQISPTDVALYRRSIGLIFQDHQLLFERSAYDNVALPLEIIGYTQESIISRVTTALRRVELAHKAHLKPQYLSIGEQQQLCIARAVVAKPILLMADEPTGNIDDELSGKIMRLFQDFISAGTTVLIATHDMKLIEFNPNGRVLELRDGRLLP